jgi:hypothetical protein
MRIFRVVPGARTADQPDTSRHCDRFVCVCVCVELRGSSQGRERSRGRLNFRIQTNEQLYEYNAVVHNTKIEMVRSCRGNA